MVISVFLLVVCLGACAKKSGLSTESCFSVAARENAMLRSAVADALPKGGKVLSIDDSTGCDSSNNGAWLSILVDAGLSKKEILQGFSEAGWSSRFEKRNLCAEGCEAEMARRFGNRTVGVTVDRVEDSSSKNTPWKLTVDDLDRCWTDSGYRCK